MKKFAMHEVHEAVEYAGAGGQALHLHTLNSGHPLFSRYPEIAHLFDQDLTRLEKTATRLGVRVVKVERVGEPGQHVDLCGRPLTLAIHECGTDSTWEKGIQELLL